MDREYVTNGHMHKIKCLKNVNAKIYLKCNKRTIKLNIY